MYQEKNRYLCKVVITRNIEHMATIYLRLSTKSDKTTSQHEVLMRFKHGAFAQRAKTNVFVHPDYWSDETQSIEIPNWRLLTDERKQLKDKLQQKSDRLNQIVSLVQSTFQTIDKDNVSKDWLKSVIDGFNYPTTIVTDEEQTQHSFFDEFNTYIDTHKFSDHRRRQNRVIWRTLKRYESYKRLSFTFDNITADTLRDFEKFLAEEHTLFVKKNEQDDETTVMQMSVEQKKYQKAFNDVPESRTPQPRGQNTINDFMLRLRSFFIWANDNDITKNNPFKHFKINESVYGTPYYITIEERNHLYSFDFSDNSTLARQRDIFVFQCLIGCRVSDLWAMTKNNIVDGAIEYIPRKTKEGRAVTVRVPLNTIAAEIIERYKDYQGTTLFPFTTQQQYNIDIKEMFKLSGLTRIVTVINPTTREEEQRPICDIASSHLARRCFVGNLYKKVKDPNLIGKLSGHKEGSRAFARYREIDEETSRELVAMLE